MVDFVKLGPLFHRVLVLLGFVGLMSQSLLIYFLQPLPRFRFRRRKALEGVILVLLILLESDLIQDIQLGREEPYGTGFRLVLGGSLLVLALWQQGDSIRCLSLCLAGMAILPFFVRELSLGDGPGPGAFSGAVPGSPAGNHPGKTDADHGVFHSGSP